MSPDELWLFAETLSVLTAAGSPLPEAFEAMAVDAPRLRKLCASTAASLRSGHSLGDALAERGAKLPPFFVAAISAGERNGRLADAAHRLARRCRRVRNLHRRLSVFLAYPLVLAALLLGLLLILDSVASAFEHLYADMGVTLPSITVWTFWLGRHAGALAILLLAAVCAAAAAAPALRRIQAVRMALSRAALRLPLIRSFSRDRACADFCEVMSLMLASGHTAHESLRYAADLSPNLYFGEAIRAAANAMEQGARLSDALDSQSLFPRRLVWALSTAEDRGELASALEEFGRTFRQEGDLRLSGLSRLALMFFILFFMFPAVLLLVTSLYLPLIRLLGWMFP